MLAQKPRLCAYLPYYVILESRTYRGREKWGFFKIGFHFFFYSQTHSDEHSPNLGFKYPRIMGAAWLETFFCSLSCFFAHQMRNFCRKRKRKNYFCFSWVGKKKKKKAALPTPQTDNNRFQSQRAAVCSTNSSCDPPIIRL